MVERYRVAREVWPKRDQPAHQGFQWRCVDVPPQTWGQWFEWVYGMPLAEYGRLAGENDHASLVAKLEEGDYDAAFDVE